MLKTLHEEQCDERIKFKLCFTIDLYKIYQGIFMSDLPRRTQDVSSIFLDGFLRSDQIWNIFLFLHHPAMIYFKIVYLVFPRGCECSNLYVGLSFPKKQSQNPIDTQSQILRCAPFFSSSSSDHYPQEWSRFLHKIESSLLPAF